MYVGMNWMKKMLFFVCLKPAVLVKLV